MERSLSPWGGGLSSFRKHSRPLMTGFDPEQVELKGPYGISEEVHPVRMAVGV